MVPRAQVAVHPLRDLTSQRGLRKYRIGSPFESTRQVIPLDPPAEIAQSLVARLVKVCVVSLHVVEEWLVGRRGNSIAVVHLE